VDVFAFQLILRLFPAQKVTSLEHVVEVRRDDAAMTGKEDD
jgi:hypothetical protein